MSARHLGWIVLLLAVATPALGERRAPRARAALASVPPAPPSIVFQAPPRTVLVPHTMVHVVDERGLDDDVFRYGVYWYAYSDGSWYRARSFRGPYRHVEVRYVPRAVLNVPGRHWKNRGVTLSRLEAPARAETRRAVPPERRSKKSS